MAIVDVISSMLFVPGSKPERFAKALACDADRICIDLEDSVPESGKGEARLAAIAAIAGGEPRLVVRINGMTTRAGLEDLLALADAPRVPELIFVPKVESAAEIAILRAVLNRDAVGIIPLIESVKGFDNIREIAAALGVVAMMFGGGDLAAELGVDLAWEPLRTARGVFVMACAGAGLPAIDVPFIHLDDRAGLAEEVAAAKVLGFSGKAAIHPAQIDAINALMRPTAEDVAEAEAAKKAFAAANGAAVRFNGRMLEAPIMRRYQRILDMRSKINA